MTLKSLLITLTFTACSLWSGATRIVVLSDIHVEPGNRNEAKLIDAVAEINTMDSVDIVVMCGDLTNEGSDVQLNNVKRILDNINRPLFIIPGNHENTWSQSATKTFFDLWGNDRFVTEIDNLVVIGCNCGPFMKMGDGHVKQEDLHWLKQTLESRVKGGKRVVSFNHYPLRKDDLDNYIEYIKILEQYPTIIHINGHYHRYLPYKSGNINSMMVSSLDQGNGNYGYSVIDINDDVIKIYRKILGNTPDLLETFEAEKTVTPYNFETTDELTMPNGFSIEKIWTDSASVFTRTGIDESKLYFGNSLGAIKAIDKKSGDLCWERATGASLFSRPCVKGNIVFVPSSVHKMMLLDAKNGKEIKSFDVNGPYVADGIIDGDNLYQGGLKMIEKRNCKSGDIIWKYDSINNYCQASPAIGGDDLLFGAWDTYLRCLDKNTGNLKWKWNNSKTNNLFSPGNVVPVIADSKIIIVAPDRYMTALDRKTGNVIWRDNSHKYRESIGVSADGKTVYAKTMDGELVAVDATSDRFSELWTVDMGIGYDHAPCIVVEKDGVVYAGSRRGILSAVDPQERKLLWNVTLGSSEINGIDSDPFSKNIYVSLVEGTIYKISKTM